MCVHINKINIHLSYINFCHIKYICICLKVFKLLIQRNSCFALNEKEKYSLLFTITSSY